MLNRLLLFVMAACLGTLFLKMELPIPYLLGGIFAAVACKIAGSPVTWPKNWRELGLLVAGYGIGRNFTADTWEKMTHQTFGVLEATLIAVAVAVLIAWWTARHTSANLISCVMGIMPGGLTQMMLMSEDDPRADANVVVVMQTLRLVGVIVAVPFLVIHGLGAQVMQNNAIVQTTDGTHWLILVPLSFLGAFVATKLKVPTPRLLGPILATAAGSYFWYRFDDWCQCCCCLVPVRTVWVFFSNRFFSNGSRRNCGNVSGWNEYGRRCFNHSYLPISTVIVFEYLRSFGNHYVF